METGVTVTVVDIDDDYLGIEVVASNGRFTGSVRKIYAAFGDLGLLADRLEGFPSAACDERSFALGTRGQGFAGGYAGLVVRTVGSLGTAVIDVELLDDDFLSEAKFSIGVEAAGIDRFVAGLRSIDAARAGAAHLSASS